MQLLGNAVAALGLAAAVFTSPVNAAEPYKLRIGWVVAGADFATLMFAKPELAPHAGKTYIPELTHFEGTSTAMQALATGELDTAALAYSTFALGVINAGMDDLRVISDGFQDGVPGYHTNGYFVRNDSGVKTVEDLKGKVNLVTTPLPFGVDPELLAFAHPLFTQVDAIGRSQMIVRVARDGFLKAH